MGKLLHATAKIYTDSSLTNLFATIDNVILGIATGTTTDVRETSITNNYTFFTSKLTDGNEGAFLGGNFYYKGEDSFNPTIAPHLFMPLCEEIVTNMWQYNYYLEYVFDNGAKMQRTGTINTGAPSTRFIDKNGNTVGTFNCSIWKPYFISSGRPVYSTPVVSSMNADGSIPNNATCAVYGYSGMSSNAYGSVEKYNSTNTNILITFFNGIDGYTPPPPDEDPYANAGETEEGGGSGSFDYTGDTIPEPSLPTVGAASTGFISLFNPSATQLQSLMDYLWSPLFDLDTIKRLYADPMQQFVGLSLVPVSVPSSGSKTIQVGGVSTGIALTAASAQFVSVDCGSITFNSNSLTASYLDFLPYTKTQLYLPYIGIVDVSTDDIMDKTISIKYHVDILTGGCIAYIIVGGSVMYQYSGQCAINVPLTSIDWSNTISSALGLVSSAMHGLVEGASIPLTGGVGVARGIEGVANMGASAVNATTNMKPTISKSGAIGGSSGIMAVQKPFLIVTCPNLARAKKQDYYIGYPSFITKSVADCSGFCSFEEIYLSGLGLTDEEMEELTAIMKEGVYL